jgi:MFS family permease
VRFTAAPDGASPTQKSNFLNVQIDAVGVGLASAAGPFLPVFLTRLGATNVQIGLLTAMPAFTGLLLSIIVGRFLQSRRNVVPWFSGARLMVISCYALTGVLSAIVPRQHAVYVVLLIWAMATLPQTVVSIAFSVVMNAVAGPEGRYALMSRRWSILGLTAAITAMVAGQILNRLSFPVNYQVVFIGLAVGGLISYYFSSHIVLPDDVPVPRTAGLSPPQRLKSYVSLIRQERPFLSFVAKRFVFLSGMTFGAPVFPIYYVQKVHATDGWIGAINSLQTGVLLIGYIVWSRQGKKRGARYVLLRTTLIVALYPALVASTHSVVIIAVLAAVAGTFQAGLDLVFFDELMKTVPTQQSAMFISLAQSLQYLSSVAMPLFGTLVAGQVGLESALVVSSLLRLIGFGLFALGEGNRPDLKSFVKRFG